MSLYGVLRTGVSGMSVQASKLGTVADNIANANTTGYKRASAEFSTLVVGEKTRAPDRSCRMRTETSSTPLATRGWATPSGTTARGRSPTG
jgi:flagellar hook protein FlgE